MAACAGAFPAEMSRGVLGNDRAETYRLARTVPWPRRRRRGPSPARLPSRRARFCRESRTSASAVFHVARNPGSARATRRIERRGARMRRTVCERRTRTSTRGANTARGSPAPHARLRSPGSSCRRTNNRGCRFSSLPAGRAEGSGVWVSNPERSSAERARRQDCERVEMSDAPLLEMRAGK